MTAAFGQSASLADTLANRPAPDPNKIGRFFQDIETGQLYRDYGTIWQPVLDPTNAGNAVNVDADYTWNGAHRFNKAVQLHSSGGLSLAQYMYQDKQENGSSPAFTGFRSEGNAAAMTNIKKDTCMVRFSGRGWNGEDWPWAATGAVEIVAAEDHAPNAHGTKLLFKTTPKGTDARAVHVAIEDTGELVTDKAIVVKTAPVEGSATFNAEISDPDNVIDGYEGLQDVSAQNSDAGTLYFRVEDDGGDPRGYHIVIYNLARCAVGDRVGVTDYITESGTSAVTAENGSGLSGTLYQVAGQLSAETISANWTITPAVESVEILRVDPDTGAITISGQPRFNKTPQVHSESNAGFVAFMYQDVGLGILTPAFHGGRSLGTEDNKLAVALNTLLTQLGGRGWDGAGWPSLATGGLRVIAAQAHTPGAHGTRLAFFTTANDTDEPTEHVGISDEGKLTTDKPIVSTTNDMPLEISNQEMVTNLNAEFLGGMKAEEFQEKLSPSSGVEVTAAAIHAALMDMGLFVE
jgi:hypothetical protein